MDAAPAGMRKLGDGEREDLVRQLKGKVRTTTAFRARHQPLSPLTAIQFCVRRHLHRRPYVMTPPPLRFGSIYN